MLAQWKLIINPKDGGIFITTVHPPCLKAAESLTATPEGTSFRFIPVPGETGWYL
jgi:hypothetical protein